MTLSCSSASPAADARVLIRKLEKHASPSPNPVRLMPPSKNADESWTVSAPNVLLAASFWGSGHGEGVTVEFATAHATSLLPVPHSWPPTNSGWRLQAAVKQLLVPR